MIVAAPMTTMARALLLVLLLIASPAWGAVAFVTDVATAPATNTFTQIAITVSGSQPVLGVSIGLNQTAGQTVSSITWSRGGSLSACKTFDDALNPTTFGTIWTLAAPAAGAGTLTITYSASVDYQADAWVFSGADQTTPCTTGDAVTSQEPAGTSVTLTPANLTASDASTGLATLTLLGNMNGVSPNQRYLDNTTNVNLETGDATGTTGITFSYNSGSILIAIAVRLKAAGAATSKPFIPERWFPSPGGPNPL
jgi:hypothetical protein